MLYSEWWELSSFFIQRLKVTLLIYKGAELQSCVEPVPSCLGSAPFPASTSFIFKSDPKMGLDTHRTDRCGAVGAKDCPQAGWLQVGLSPGVAASLQPGPEGLCHSQPGTPGFPGPSTTRASEKADRMMCKPAILQHEPDLPKATWQERQRLLLCWEGAQHCPRPPQPWYFI